MLVGSSAALPSASTPSGVAVDVASAAILGAGHVVISVAKEINSTILAVIAGFAIFLPTPPNNCLMTMIATKQPTMAIQ